MLYIKHRKKLKSFLIYSEERKMLRFFLMSAVDVKLRGKLNLSSKTFKNCNENTVFLNLS